MSNELKPCPFCGSTDLYVVQARIEEYHSVEPEISCKECRYTIKVNELAIAIDDSPKTNADRWDRCSAKKWNCRPAEDALEAQNKKLKEKLALVKKHVVDNRNALLFMLKSGQDRERYSEFAFCQNLIELINTDTKKESEE